MRPYQLEAAIAIAHSVYARKGLTFTVEIARQGGKNELSAQLETYLLMDHADQNKNLIKCSPTFKPQTIVSMMRLKDTLSLAGFDEIFETEMGYIIKLGNARTIFLSAEENSNVVGNTAHILLEVDEAQDVNEEKYSKEFKPMGSTTNVTNVLYGTTWDDSTLLEKMKQINLELERKDGIKRHFRYDWQEVARYNPEYLAYVESERVRLGENHPLFLTQYRLLPIRGGGGFLSSVQKAQLQGEHCRQHHPKEKIEVMEDLRFKNNDLGRTKGGLLNPESTPSPRCINHPSVYIAGIDLAGEAETSEDDFLKSLKPKQDSTVITIGELIYDSGFKIDESKPSNSHINPESTPLIPFLNRTSSIKIIEHYTWTGRKHAELYPQFIDLIKNVWHCRAVVVDATGIGQPVASFLKNALGSRIIPFVFSSASKTQIGFNLLAAVNSGALKMYAADNSPEYREFWFQIDKARGYYRPSQTMNFYVDPADGHDDYLMSLALLVEAGKQYEPREAKGK
jgi:hypothetical protein